MGAPKYKGPAKKAGPAGQGNQKQQVQEIQKLKELIHQTLQSDEGAKKAALVIEKLIKTPPSKK